MTTRILTAAVGLAISAVAIWWTLHHIDLTLVASTMRGVWGPRLLILLAGQIGILTLKTLRWNRILAPVRRLSLSATWNLLLIGFLGTNVLPARLGEVVRMWLLERNYGFSLAQAAGTIVVERYLDVLLVLAQFGIAVFFVPIPMALKQGATTVLLGTVVVGASILALALRGPAAAVLVEKWLPGRPGQMLGRLVARLAEGMGALRQGQLLGQIVLLSVCIWTAEVTNDWYAMLLYGLPATMAWSGFFVGVSAMSQMIPSGPGYIGSAQAVATQVLGVFGVTPSVAVSVSLTLWTMGFALTVFFGLIGYLQEIRKPALTRGPEVSSPG